MNINKFTIKSQEALQKAQLIAQELGQQQLENEHLFKGILEVDENVTPFILKKLNVISLIEARANLLLKDKTIYQSNFHTDKKFKCNTAILYINTCMFTECMCVFSYII